MYARKNKKQVKFVAHRSMAKLVAAINEGTSDQAVQPQRYKRPEYIRAWIWRVHQGSREYP